MTPPATDKCEFFSRLFIQSPAIECTTTTKHLMKIQHPVCIYNAQLLWWTHESQSKKQCMRCIIARPSQKSNSVARSCVLLAYQVNDIIKTESIIRFVLCSDRSTPFGRIVCFRCCAPQPLCPILMRFAHNVLLIFVTIKHRLYVLMRRHPYPIALLEKNKCTRSG